MQILIFSDYWWSMVLNGWLCQTACSTEEAGEAKGNSWSWTEEHCCHKSFQQHRKRVRRYINICCFENKSLEESGKINKYSEKVDKLTKVLLLSWLYRHSSHPLIPTLIYVSWLSLDSEILFRIFFLNLPGSGFSFPLSHLFVLYLKKKYYSKA